MVRAFDPYEHKTQHRSALLSPHKYANMSNEEKAIGEKMDAPTTCCYTPNHDNHAAAAEEALPLITDEKGQPHKSKRTCLSTVSRSKIITTLGCIIIIALVLGYFSSLDESPLESKPEKPTGLPTTNWALNYVETFPDVDPERASVQCLKAWYELTAVSCHTALWTTTPEFTLTQIRGLRIDEFFELVCAANCTEALLTVNNSISSACAGGQDVFTLDRYERSLNTTLTPAVVADELKKRQAYICQKSPVGNDTERFCLPDLDTRWHIRDTIRSNGLSALPSFRRWTRRYFKSPAVHYPDLNYYREERRYGPGRNTTTCGWCTLKWFEEKLGMWQEGMLMDQEQLSLPYFLRIWETAGRRCEGNDFFEIYNAAIDSYKKQGLLSEGWEKQVLGDISYLIRHGPSQGDFPIPQIEGAISVLKNYYEKNAVVPSIEVRQNDLEVVDEYISCLEWFKTAVQRLPCYPLLSPPEIKTHLFSSVSTMTDACTWDCGGAIAWLQREKYDACPAMRHARWEEYDIMLPHSLKTDLEFSFEPFFAKAGTFDLWNSACRKSVGSIEDIPCAAVFKQWNAEDWVFQKPSWEMLFRTTREQLTLLPEIPPKFRAWRPNATFEMTEQDRAMLGEFMEWETKILGGVCNTCVWDMYMPSDGGIDAQIKEFEGLDQETAIEWIRSVHEIKRECEKHGASAYRFRVKDVDEAWIR